MPIPIIIAILLALFTLGAKVHLTKDHPAEVVILGGQQYNWVDKKNNHDTLVLMAPEQNDHKIFIHGQRSTGSFENLFRETSLLRFMDDDDAAIEDAASKNATPENKTYIKSNTQQAVCMSVK